MNTTLGSDASTRDVRFRPVLLAYFLLAAATVWPYLQASVFPPRGTLFLGAFYYYDDFYNYLTFVQQAEDGAFLFRNKLFPGSPATLVNLEWWLVGRLSALFGNSPLLAYRAFGLLAALALVAAADRWLRAGGLPATHRLPALVLVAFGSGFGGLRYALGAPVQECLDLLAGLFPFVEVLANPHFVAATALLAWSFFLISQSAGRAPLAAGLVLGNILGLVRPYDVVLLVASVALFVALTEPLARWAGRLLPLLALAPVLAYDVHVLLRQPWFKSFSQTTLYAPHLYLSAIGPSAVLAVLAFVGVRPAEPAWRARVALGSWALLACAISLLAFSPLPFHFAQQLLVGIGVPLLGLAALGLARFRPAATLGVTVLLGTTAAAALSIVSRNEPSWYRPDEVLLAGRAFRGVCRPGDLAVAPQEIGMLAAAYSACDAYVSHGVAPGHALRAARTAAIYGAVDPVARARLLTETCATHVVIPEETNAVPSGWLGEDTPFRRVAHVQTRWGNLGLYRRPAIEGCRPADVPEPR